MESNRLSMCHCSLSRSQCPSLHSFSFTSQSPSSSPPLTGPTLPPSSTGAPPAPLPACGTPLRAPMPPPPLHGFLLLRGQADLLRWSPAASARGRQRGEDHGGAMAAAIGMGGRPWRRRSAWADQRSSPNNQPPRVLPFGGLCGKTHI